MYPDKAVVSSAATRKRLKSVVSGDHSRETWVAIWGQSNASSIDSCLERLGKSEFTRRVEVLEGNSLFVMGSLTKMKDLDKHVRFVTGAAEMPEPTVGIMCHEDGIHRFDKEKKESHKRLSPLDLKTVTLLRDGARKPVAEIADAIGVSTKTARRHLDRMISESVVVYNLPWDLTSGEGMSTLLFVKLRGSADKVGVAKRLLLIDPTHFNFIGSISNKPNFFIGLVCSNRMSELRKIVREVAEDEDVAAVTPSVIYDERMYWDQDSRCPAVLSHTPRRSSKKGPHSRPNAE